MTLSRLPKKAIDGDYMTFLTMLVCYELGKTEEEITNWGPHNVIRWAAFFRLKNKMEAKAIEEAKKKNKRK
jgi:cell division protein ZapA (FtsZ GTPase activity inhibitor)